MAETKLLSEVYDDLKTGDLAAFRVRRYNGVISFVLKLFQYFMKNKYSHVGVIYKEADTTFIVEAIAPRVVFTPIQKVEDFYLIKTDMKAEEKEQKRFLIEKYGMPYRLYDLITHFLGMDYSKTSVYCSMLANEFYYYFGYLTERESGHTPDKLVKAVKARAGVEESTYIITDRGNLK